MDAAHCQDYRATHSSLGKRKMIAHGAMIPLHLVHALDHFVGLSRQFHTPKSSALVRHWLVVVEVLHYPRYDCIRHFHPRSVVLLCNPSQAPVGRAGYNSLNAPLGHLLEYCEHMSLHECD